MIFNHASPSCSTPWYSHVCNRFLNMCLYLPLYNWTPDLARKRGTHDDSTLTQKRLPKGTSGHRFSHNSIHTPENNTPRKINIELEHDGLVQMIFLFQGCILRFQPFIFRGFRRTWKYPQIGKETSTQTTKFWGWKSSSVLLETCNPETRKPLVVARTCSNQLETYCWWFRNPGLTPVDMVNIPFIYEVFIHSRWFLWDFRTVNIFFCTGLVNVFIISPQTCRVKMGKKIWMKAPSSHCWFFLKEQQ